MYDKNPIYKDERLYCPYCYKLEKPDDPYIIKINNPLEEKNGIYGKFFGCQNYPKCKYTISFKDANNFVTSKKIEKVTIPPPTIQKRKLKENNKLELRKIYVYNELKDDPYYKDKYEFEQEMIYIAKSETQKTPVLNETKQTTKPISLTKPLRKIEI